MGKNIFDGGIPPYGDMSPPAKKKFEKLNKGEEKGEKVFRKDVNEFSLMVYVYPTCPFWSGGYSF